MFGIRVAGRWASEPWGTGTPDGGGVGVLDLSNSQLGNTRTSHTQQLPSRPPVSHSHTFHKTLKNKKKKRSARWLSLTRRRRTDVVLVAVEDGLVAAHGL